jgi:hypothetical protein
MLLFFKGEIVSHLRNILINVSIFGGTISMRHSRGAECVAIVKTTPNPIFVIPGLTRNPVSFQSFSPLDAGSVIPDLIRDRHDEQKLDEILNCDTASEAGIQAILS